MTGMFSIDPQGLRDSGYAISNVGDQLEAQKGSLRSGIAGGDDVWGVDEIGVAFRAPYLDVADAAAHTLSALANGIADVGAAVRATADHTEENDRAAEDALKRLLDALS